MIPSLLRLWVITFALNLVGGILFALVFAVEGVLPTGSPEVIALGKFRMFALYLAGVSFRGLYWSMRPY